MKHILVKAFITAVTALAIGSTLPPHPPVPPIIPGEPGIEAGTEGGGTAEPQDDETKKDIEKNQIAA